MAQPKKISQHLHNTLKGKPYVSLILGCVGILSLIFLGITSILYGASSINVATIVESIFHFDDSNSQHVIIRELRIPRAIAAIAVGAALAVSGAIMQGMTKNPLASPSIMGVTAGSSFVLSLAMAILPSLPYQSLILFSFIGAGVGAFLVFGMVALAKGGITPIRLVLAGSAITSLLTSLSTIISIRFDIAKDISFFYAGGVSSIQMHHLTFAFPAIGIGLVLAIFLSRSITVLSLGEDIAKGLGQNTTRIQLFGTITVLILTGAAVSIAGMIGFVGLVIPHITRFFVGLDYRFIIPCSAILGGLLLLGADIVGRMVNPPFETPVGAITALVGVPFFLYLARKEGRTLN
ncbi:iron ABC transporter permease [Lysinibacillus sp. SGAir0095]|uniref:FecCD family ABC transporter permease n=1 Tax=Lysinibacillus sp. SGAir0095 TaxID=2070463 RepID=UPI0010CD5FDA|nr:iron ABC transporter permease [Lysinibacillus sp. SGAir0095]QCR30950.1 ferrichrome ABC transporter permease [Lysinibacillus sp. SGAir0095]